MICFILYNLIQMIDQNPVQENSKEDQQNQAIKQQPRKPVRAPPKRHSRKFGKRSKKYKNKQVQDQYIQNKMCENCHGQQNEQKLLLCDRCDDSYHAYCLQIPLETVPQKVWICDVCNSQLKQLRLSKGIQMSNQIIEEDCFMCKKPLAQPPSIKGIDQQGKPMQIELKTFNNIKCLYCKHNFHNKCFSQRKNSLNCWTCEKWIRKNGPKCHDDFMSWIEANIKSVQNNECQFAPIQNIQDDNSVQRYRNYRLKVPSYMTTWQSIAENEASIYYSFKSKGLTFIDDQLYEKKDYQQMMNLNKPKNDIYGSILRLHQNDQSIYQLFKINSKKGYVGPFEVKQDRTKGFYLIASEFIQPMTIISEYVGEVKTTRAALNFEENDSIFILVRSSRSVQSLDIVPQLYGNISRFFLGINNKDKKQRGSAKLENVKSLRFSYKGRVRLLLYTSKPIQAGETLYFNYNGSHYEYPTEHFVT